MPVSRACILLLFAARAFAQNPSIVQSVSAGVGATISANGTTVILVFGTTPTAGDTLCVGVSAADVITTPAGWTLIDSKVSAAIVYAATFSHVVASGEMNSYAFVQASSSVISAVGYEITGKSPFWPLVITGHTMSQANNATSLATTGVTPIVLGELALTFGMEDDSAFALSTVSSGWTIDQAAMGYYRSSWGSSRTALTSDTSTPITNTFNWSGIAGNVIVAAILISLPAIPSYGGIL